MIGLEGGIVSLSRHDEGWHQLFSDERDQILDAVGDQTIPVEHIGSTSICGIAAKPILDIMIGTPEFEQVLPFVADLEAIGYEYKGENGISERHFFGKGVQRTVHLHIVRFGGDLWLSHLGFRDYLKQNDDAARRYEQLKLSLAVRYPHDREAYTNGKEEFIKNIIARTMGS
jgi:GrpB-like predicted nucleotidyltransferase (UPF0157 family)